LKSNASFSAGGRSDHRLCLQWDGCRGWMNKEEEPNQSQVKNQATGRQRCRIITLMDTSRLSNYVWRLDAKIDKLDSSDRIAVIRSLVRPPTFRAAFLTSDRQQSLELHQWNARTRIVFICTTRFCGFCCMLSVVPKCSGH
jgi:hypothetical protein